MRTKSSGNAERHSEHGQRGARVVPGSRANIRVRVRDAVVTGERGGCVAPDCACRDREEITAFPSVSTNAAGCATYLPQ